jgi:hypothetical protein
MQHKNATLSLVIDNSSILMVTPEELSMSTARGRGKWRANQWVRREAWHD